MDDTLITGDQLKGIIAGLGVVVVGLANYLANRHKSTATDKVATMLRELSDKIDALEAFQSGPRAMADMTEQKAQLTECIRLLTEINGAVSRLERKD
jgi:hypothetical protein